MDERELAEIEVRAGDATPGPWRSAWTDPPTTATEEVVVESLAEGLSPVTRIVVGTLWRNGLCVVCPEPDAAFIAAARADVPALVAEVRRLRAEVERLRSISARSTGTTLDVLAVYEQEDDATTTVAARVSALGVRRSNALTWAAGATVRRAWLRAFGSLPPKANTSKTSGHGSHCHARYPTSWRGRIDEIVLACAGSDPRQLSLFDEVDQ